MVLFTCITNNVHSSRVIRVNKCLASVDIRQEVFTERRHLREKERWRESQWALFSKLGLTKKNERTRDEQRAGKQAGQSLVHPTKKLTPEKLTHQRATKDERETKQLCVVLASLCPSSLTAAPLSLPHF